MRSRIQTNIPTVRVRNVDVPKLRAVGSPGVLVPAQGAMSFSGPGYLMGMLALTYTKIQTRQEVPAIFRSDYVPFARIRTTD